MRFVQLVITCKVIHKAPGPGHDTVSPAARHGLAPTAAKNCPHLCREFRAPACGTEAADGMIVIKLAGTAALSPAVSFHASRSAGWLLRIVAHHPRAGTRRRCNAFILRRGGRRKRGDSRFMSPRSRG